MSSGQRKARRIAITVVSVLLGLMFLMAGGTKLMGAENHVEAFNNWGYPLWFMYATGSVEVLAAILILVPRTRLYGAAILVCTMLGAVFTHLMAKETERVVVPLVLLLIAVFIGWNERARERESASAAAAGGESQT